MGTEHDVGERDAAGIFRSYLAKQYAGEQVDIASLCAAHPQCTDELKRLDASYRRTLELLDRLGPPSFVARLRQERGHGMAPTVKLGSSDPAMPDDRQRPRRARYEVRGEIGRGGMGTVLHVWDEDLRRSLAMKMILESEVNEETFTRFLAEAQITGQLDHPGIVPVHELGLDQDGRLYFTMRFVKGRTLREIFHFVWKEEDGWNQTRGLNVVLRVCEAMAFAHEKGVIHRDLKPGNIMVGRFGETYVMDWGLARVLGEKDRRDHSLRSDGASLLTRVVTVRETDWEQASESPLLTLDGDVVGTPAYMPPEQALGRVSEVGPRADVYSVGALLYQLLTGQPPYISKGAKVSPRTVLEWVINGPPRRLTALNPRVTGELVAICEKAMAREPEHRYPNMGAMADDLRAYLEHRVVRAYQTGAIAELRKWVQRNKPLAAAIAAAVLLLAVGLIGTSLLWRRADRNEQLANDRLGEVLRMSDVKRLADLRAREPQLWPEVPARMAAMTQWLEEVRQLIANLELHKSALAELRNHALPYDAKTEQQDRETHPDAERLCALEAEWQRLDGLRTDDASEDRSVADENRAAQRAELEKRLASLESDIDATQAVVRRRRTWVFSSTQEKWRHDILSELVQGIEKLSDPDPRSGSIASMRARLERAGRAYQETITDHRAEWDRAIASIADVKQCPQYQGLTIKEQIGLVPIGRDQASGLWEFAFPRTGRIPDRDAEGKIIRTEAMCLVFVLLPGGTFAMGAQSKDRNGPNFDDWSEADESPVNQIALDPFFISKYEMTKGQWLAVTGVDPSIEDHFKLEPRDRTPLHPVQQVSYDGCHRVLEQLGLVLPTEAQWEYGARARTSTRFWTGSDLPSLGVGANVADKTYSNKVGHLQQVDDAVNDGYAYYAPVGSLRANLFGLHDTAGNVWEWCRDWYGSYDSPVKKGDGERIVMTHTARMDRGGSFAQPASYARSAERNQLQPGDALLMLGVRPARQLE